MAPIISHPKPNTLFSLLFLSTLAFLVCSSSSSSSRLDLLPSDHNALVRIHADFAIHHFPVSRNFCSTAGIFCQRQLTTNNTYNLRVTRLLLDSHRLKGRLSPAIGNLSELKELSLHNNQISNQIPPQIIDCQKLVTLNLGKNLFSGKIPPGLSSLIRLRVLDLSSNKFTGNLEFLKHFPNMERLNLADNLFSGKIPASLRSFRNLRFIDVSGNFLLESDNLSNSILENKPLPARYVFAENPRRRNQSYSAVAPAPSQSANSGAGASPPTSTPKRGHKRNKKKIVQAILGFLTGVLAGGISGLVFGLFFKLLLLIRRRKRDMKLNIFSPLIKGEDLAFLENDNGLSSLPVIGRGGCGEVYKAVLPGSNGKEIAIKKIIQPLRDAGELSEDSKLLTKKMRQIKSEIQTMGRIRHKNLLSLLAHLPRPDSHFLVYEYMKNGSLQDCLQQVAEGRRTLDWPARYKIALGVASGLEYLHMNQSPRIIHRDLKPGNVLLDDEMEARIADFGLAKAVPDAHTHVTSSNVAGTVGYIAPEYYQTFKFTDKCDVYSFGVVLGALVVGKLPSDEFFQHTDEMSMVKWMRKVMASEEPKQAIDPKLLGNGYEEQMLLVLKVACFCTLENPKERPNSKDARCMLAQITH
ncbi:Leucine-rich repeat receptor-like serine/threonine/tyrosine-protein kinase SOBIR1 [Striga hermonthica]|uniref:Leucine-rich repeat receptor-like serine/threonine/tyrosine-protein kinase SOBIR1 n=1 Tax=Striga hermonthica TaxID=68872 RepID=A0A9N7NSK9_STRHE|nr:Leucine-rich repeat receptor-like serine/threonine/tyrosine-protein kinase SOBIR1 [Striga hermonthica]